MTGGGPTTPDLVAAGAPGFLAAGYQTAQAVRADMDAVRAATSGAFGVNLFVPGPPTSRPPDVPAPRRPGPPTSRPAATAAYVGSLASDADALGVAPGDPAWDDGHWAAKVAALVADPPAIVSSTFGCPPGAT